MSPPITPEPAVHRGRISLHETADGNVRGVPWIRYSRGAGPLLALTSTVHGNEVTGIRALQMLQRHLREADFQGTVWMAPVINSAGFELNRRELPETAEDLNRFFPGRGDGSPVERLAHAVYATLSGLNPDCHVDLHADATASIPYVIFDRYLNAKAERLRRRLEAYGAAFGVVRLYDWPLAQYRASRLDASLSGSMVNEARVPSFTLELGPCRYADESMATLAFEGLVRLLVLLGMAAGDSGTRPPPVTLRRSTALRAERAGVAHFTVQPGQEVVRGQPLVELSDLFGENVEVLESPADGLVLSIPDRYWCTPGTALLTLAVADD